MNPKPGSASSLKGDALRRANFPRIFTLARVSRVVILAWVIFIVSESICSLLLSQGWLRALAASASVVFVLPLMCHHYLRELRLWRLRRQLLAHQADQFFSRRSGYDSLKEEFWRRFPRTYRPGELENLRSFLSQVKELECALAVEKVSPSGKPSEPLKASVESRTQS